MIGPSADSETEARGFTLIELLVVLSVVAILLGLLLPAVQSAREAARRAHCAGNLRQLGLALQGYADVFGSLPPGRVRSYDPRYAGSNPPCTSRTIDKSYEVSILPFLEQRTVYNAINQDLVIFGAENSTVHVAAIGCFVCPSDWAASSPVVLNPGTLEPFGVHDPARMSLTSYAGCMGSFLTRALPSPRNRCRPATQAVAQCDGVLNDVSPIGFASVTDGLSHTIFLAEKATSIVQELQRMDSRFPANHGWYVTGNWGDTLITAFYPPNACDRAPAANAQAWAYSASSLHPGGIHVAMGDGSVRFIRDSIESWPLAASGEPLGAHRDQGGWWKDTPRPCVWQALASRSGGEGGETEP